MIGHESQQAQHLDKTDDEGVHSAQLEGEKAMPAENAVGEDLDQFDLGDDKGDINE